MTEERRKELMTVGQKVNSTFKCYICGHTYSRSLMACDTDSLPRHNSRNGICKVCYEIAGLDGKELDAEHLNRFSEFFELGWMMRANL